jgi:sec-independent protein translocase protein TatB
MFDFSSGELLLIAVAALVFIKPKDLPGALRVVGQWTGKIRRMAGEFQDQFREVMREAEMADLKRDVDEAASKFTSGSDPFGDIQRAVEWKPPESTGTSAAPASASPSADVPLPADAPPAPPAEAIVAEPAAAPPTAPAEPGTQADVTQGDSAPPPAGGDRGA